METKRIDGILFDKLIRSGLNNLKLKEQEINDLNVFPVPDGDTGVNMRLTLQHGIESTKPTKEIGAYLKDLAYGMLMGARGNSGVILSQLFYGFSQALSRYSSANAHDYENALIRGYKTAYSSVQHPVEGTILTVAREGVEGIKTRVTRSTDFESFFSFYISEMKRTLATTPDMLDVLKEAGVVDSGAVGFITIAEGMYKELRGEEIVNVPATKDEPSAPTVLTDSFTENTPFNDGYCMEFMLQLMAPQEGYSKNFVLSKFTETLEELGDSIVAVQNETRVKVHIHTKKPAKIIIIAQRFGEFVTFKLENMQLQHNEHNERLKNKTAIPHTPVSYIAVVNGEGVADLYKGLGCKNLILCPDTMNASAEEFVNEINNTNSDKVVILPNDKNIFKAAEQGVQLSGIENVEILSTKSVVDGYFALAMDIPDGDIESRLSSVRLGVGMSSCLEIAKANKDYSSNGVNVTAGDYIAVLDGEIVSSVSDEISAVVNAASEIEDIDDKECCILLYGKDVSEDDAMNVADALMSKYPMLEVQPIYGGHSVYDYIIGIS